MGNVLLTTVPELVNYSLNIPTESTTVATTESTSLTDNIFTTATGITNESTTTGKLSFFLKYTEMFIGILILLLLLLLLLLIILLLLYLRL